MADTVNITINEWAEDLLQELSEFTVNIWKEERPNLQVDRLVNWFKNFFQIGSFSGLGNSFGPYFANLDVLSSFDNPFSLVCREDITSAVSITNQRESRVESSVDII